MDIVIWLVCLLNNLLYCKQYDAFHKQFFSTNSSRMVRVKLGGGARRSCTWKKADALSMSVPWITHAMYKMDIFLMWLHEMEMLDVNLPSVWFTVTIPRCLISCLRANYPSTIHRMLSAPVTSHWKVVLARPGIQAGNVLSWWNLCTCLNVFQMQ